MLSPSETAIVTIVAVASADCAESSGSNTVVTATASGGASASGLGRISRSHFSSLQSPSSPMRSMTDVGRSRGGDFAGGPSATSASIGMSSSSSSSSGSSSSSVEASSRAVVHAIWNAVEELAAFPQLLDDRGFAGGTTGEIPGGAPVVGGGLSALSRNKRQAGNKLKQQALLNEPTDKLNSSLDDGGGGGGPSDYSLTLSALTALAVKQGELPALLKAVRLLLFGSSFYIPPPPPATYSAPPPSSTLSDAQPNMR